MTTKDTVLSESEKLRWKHHTNWVSVTDNSSFIHSANMYEHLLCVRQSLEIYWRTKLVSFTPSGGDKQCWINTRINLYCISQGMLYLTVITKKHQTFRISTWIFQIQYPPGSSSPPCSYCLECEQNHWRWARESWGFVDTFEAPSTNVLHLFCLYSTRWDPSTGHLKASRERGYKAYMYTCWVLHSPWLM